jgi:dTMP kinase
MLIVYEGGDKCGKTTQCKMLLEYLQKKDKPCVFYRFPDRGTPTGQILNDYLLKRTKMSPQCAHLLFSANRWEKAQEIREHLSRGTYVICDRYMYSGLVYSLCQNLDQNWCENTDHGLPQPDILFYLTPDFPKITYDGELYENINFQARVHEIFTEIMKKNEHVVLRGDRDVMFETVLQHISKNHTI